MQFGQWIGLFSLFASVYVLWQIRQALLLLFAAIVLATALNKLARKLQKLFKIRRSGGVLLSISLFFLTLISFILLIIPPFVKQLKELVLQVPLGIDKLNEWIEQINQFSLGNFGKGLPFLNGDEIWPQIEPYLNQVLGGAGAFLGGTFGAIIGVWFLLIFTFMLLADPHSYRQAFVQLFPSFYRRRVHSILDQCEIALGRWAIGALISMSVVTFLTFIGLSILGVRLALANAIIAGLLNFIPNLGPTLSIFPPMAIALLDSPLKSGLVLMLYIAIQQFEGNFLTPFVMAQQVSLLPALTLIIQIFFATFFGFLGLLLALPLAVIMQVWIKNVVIEDILNPWETAENKKSISIEIDSLNIDLEPGLLRAQNPIDSSSNSPN